MQGFVSKHFKTDQKFLVAQTWHAACKQLAVKGAKGVQKPNAALKNKYKNVPR